MSYSDFPDITRQLHFSYAAREAKHFFVACGYRAPAVEIQVLFKRNGAAG